MNPRMLVASAVFIVAVGAVVAAQTRPNFAGRWRPADATDASSDLIITQDATTLTLGHAHGEGHHRSTHDLSGKPHKSPNPAHPSEHDTSIARWEESTLIIDITLTNNVKLKHRLSLNSEGLLTFEATTVFPDGRTNEVTKTVFRKQ